LDAAQSYRRHAYYESAAALHLELAQAMERAWTGFEKFWSPSMSKTLRQRIFEDTGYDMISPISIARDQRLRALYEAWLKFLSPGPPYPRSEWRWEEIPNRRGKSKRYVECL